MKTGYVGKNKGKALKILLLVPVLLLVVFGAARLGIFLGNYFYSADFSFIESIDTDYFKTTLNTSLPIINTVYNSGNTGFSIEDEFKAFLGGIFNIDPDYPASIFNSQSSLFYSYYMKRYMPGMLADGEGSGTETRAPGPTPVLLPTPQPTPQDTDPSAGQAGGIPTPSPTPGPGKNVADNGDNRDNGSNTGTGEMTGTVLEPASSIVYEEEDEENRENGDIVSHGKVVVQNYTPYKVDIEKLLSEPLKLNFSKKGPKVLIYHTHTRESYVLKALDFGKKSVPLYNNNPNYNVVRVGEELARTLRKLGIDTLHNGTVHDYNHPSAYSASLKTLKQYTAGYPSLRIFFDIHRDGLSSNQPKMRVVTKIGKSTAAQVMFVVGTGGNNLPHPTWRENLKFALKLQQKLNEKYPGLARPVYISKNRYNQHISDESLIIEIGGDGNLLDECVLSARYVAKAVNDVIKEN